MTRYVRIGGDVCWYNENFEIVKDVNTKQCSFFHSGIRFVNGDITQIKNGYLFCVSLNHASGFRNAQLMVLQA